MPVNTFGVTPAEVRAHYFPSQSDFTADTHPSVAAVTTMVLESAAIVGGYLTGAGVSPGAVLAGSAGYSWCAHLTRLLAALRVFRATLPAGAPQLKELSDEAAAMLGRLDDEGASVLGDSSLVRGGAQASSHVTQLDLQTDSLHLSESVPRLRRDDGR